MNNLSPPTGLPKDHVSTTIVFFLGGCTFTEIAALRKMKAGSKGEPYSSSFEKSATRRAFFLSSSLPLIPISLFLPQAVAS